jgi:hypothetical protein
MPVYMISYDLHEGEDYENLLEAIKKLSPSNYWHGLDSTWFIVNNGPATTIINSLSPHIKNPDRQNGDKLLVLEIKVPANWTTSANSFGEDSIEWLRNIIAR